MCGIIGYTGQNGAIDRVLCGLYSLEYRGYDSAGVAFFEEGGRIGTKKSLGKIALLEDRLKGLPREIACAIGHTRWATHGAPSEENSHPHGGERLKLVHNGIIENYATLKEELISLGYAFESDTDTEVAAHLIDFYRKHEADPISAIRCACARLCGSFAFGIIFSDRPGEIYATRRESPLIVGVTERGNFIASDVTAILRETRDYYRMRDGEIAILRKGSVEFRSPEGKVIEKSISRADWDPESASLGGFEHYMLKEINEEPSVISRTLARYISGGAPSFDDLDREKIRRAARIHIVACGTALHAGMYGGMLIEKWARIPVACEVASEFRYRDPILGTKDIVILVSQSGETADTLAALRMARKAGCYTVGVVNVVGSSIAREADSVIYTYAGPEIAVASTKAYSVQSALLALVALEISLLKGGVSQTDAARATYELQNRLPQAIGEIIDRSDEWKKIAEEIAETRDLYFIGRGQDYFAAIEASLKLKEISYIHSEAYAAGELKHGSISLIEAETPVIALSTCARLRGKMISNIKEVSARGGYVISIGLGGEDELAEVSDRCFALPSICEDFAIIAAATALQLVAYYTANLRGCDVDRPRNLAKSVTVE